jgi:predicted Zn-dependent protease
VNAAGRALIVVPALALLGALAVVAIAAGRAADVAFDASQDLDRWDRAHAAPPPGRLERMRRELAQAARAVPGDPAVQEVLGVIALRDSPGDPEALKHFTRAIELRPSSPYAWAGLAAVEYGRGGHGPRFEAALRNASFLGPSEPEVQRTVADYGLAVWDEVAPRTRAAVERSVAGAMARDPAETLQIAFRRGRLAVACRHLQDPSRQVDPGWRELCRRRETTS